MDVPDLVRRAVGDEDIRAGVNLGDEDAVVFTPTRALVYRGEGLLSDEDVADYEFDFERLAVSEGRRKTKFTMSYVDGERSFTVPGKRTDDVLEQLVEGTLRVSGAIDGGESVTGVFRFSEMTLVVTEGRLLKHIGEYTWDADYEAFPYDELTQLAFEEGSVATQVVLGVGDRSERIKAPNAEAGLVRKTLQEAVFSHYGVGSLEELNREIAVEAEGGAGQGDPTGGFGLDSGIDPLVSEDEAAEREDPSGATAGQSASAGDGASRRGANDAAGNEPGSAGGSGNARAGEGRSSTAASGGSAGRSASESASSTEATGSSREASAGDASTSDGGTARPGTTGGDEAVSIPAAAPNGDEVAEQLSDLTQAVERQNELLHRQQRTIEKLIEELREGR